MDAKVGDWVVTPRRGKAVEINAPQVVVDDIENHADTASMRCVHEPAEVIGMSVQSGRGKQVDTVVSPAEASGEIGHRHDLEQGDAQFLQLRELPARRLPGPLLGEGADVHFVDDLPRHAGPGPVSIGPFKGLRQNNQGGAEGPVGLKS
jgi:hypothetical protein